LTIDEFPDDDFLYTLVHNAQNVQLNVASASGGAKFILR